MCVCVCVCTNLVKPEMLKSRDETSLDTSMHVGVDFGMQAIISVSADLEVIILVLIAVLNP